jgi:hypothetical protein
MDSVLEMLQRLNLLAEGSSGSAVQHEAGLWGGSAVDIEGSAMRRLM